MTLKKDLKLASFDAGGPECLLQLEGMQEIMERLRTKIYPNDSHRIMLPYEYFDLMGGSGTGGLIVILLVRLQMPVTEASTELASLLEKVYSDDQITAEDQTILLKTSMEDLLRKRGLPIDLKLKTEEDHDKCGGFVLATPRVGLGELLSLRTYDVKRSPSSTITVVDAALATCALQRLAPFTSVEQGRGYMGPGLVGSNPVRAVLCEASLRYNGDSSVAYLLSLGARRHNNVDISLLDQKVLPESLEATKVAQEVHPLLDRIGFYYRYPGCLNKDNAGNCPSDTDTTAEDCVDSLIAKDGAITLNLLYKICRMKVLHSVPPKMSIRFVARDDPLRRLRIATDRKHSERKFIIVNGKAGCGKTQLVRRMMEDNTLISRFKHVLWLNATSETSMRSDILKQAGPITMSIMQEATTPVNSDANWLIVCNNADDPCMDLFSLLPVGNGVVIITTSNGSFSSLASEPQLYLKLDAMSVVEAADVIRQSAKQESSSSEDTLAAAAIAEKLDYLPLALALAGCFISESACTNMEYLALLGKHLSLSADTSNGGQPDPVATACTISFQRVPRSAQRFLQLLSMLEATNFPLAAIPLSAKHDFRNDPISFVNRTPEVEAPVRLLGEIFLRDGSWSDLTLSEMALALEKYSFASFMVTTDTTLVQIHPLVRVWALNQTAPDELVVFRDAACRLVAGAMSDIRVEPYLPAHIEALLRFRQLGPIHLNELAAFGKILVNLGMDQRARPIWAEIYTELREIYGTQNLHVATAALELGGAHDDQTLDQMEQFETESVNIREKLLGPHHLETLRAKGALAGTFQRQKRHEEAVQLKEEVLRGLKLQLSPIDPNVLNALFWLAWARMGRTNDVMAIDNYDDSVDLWSQLLEGNRSCYGRTNPKTLTAMEILAIIDASQGRYSCAEKVQSEVVDILSKQLGENHAATLLHMSWLGCISHKEGKYAQSEDLLTKAVKGLKRELGGRHEETLKAMGSLAGVYQNQKRYSDAESLELEILAARKETAGEEDQLTIEAMEALANNYHEQHRYTEAEGLRLKALEMMEGDFFSIQSKEQHIYAMRNLVETYLALKQYDEATKLQAKILEEYEALLGWSHTTTLNAMYVLSKMYQEQGRLADAESLQLREIRGWEAQPNPTNPTLFTVMANLAYTQILQGRYAEAEAIQAKMLDRRRADLGDSHPDTTIVMHNLACTYGALSRYPEAVRLWSLLLKARYTSLGEKHPDTRSARKQLLISYARMGAMDALVAMKQHFGEKDLKDLATTLTASLAAVYCNINQYSEAVVVQVELVRAKILLEGSESLPVAVASSTLARIYYKMDLLDQAEEIATEAARVMWRLKGGEGPEYQATITLLEEIRKPTLSSTIKWIKRIFF